MIIIEQLKSCKRESAGGIRTHSAQVTKREKRTIASLVQPAACSSVVSLNVMNGDPAPGDFNRSSSAFHSAFLIHALGFSAWPDGTFFWVRVKADGGISPDQGS